MPFGRGRRFGQADVRCWRSVRVSNRPWHGTGDVASLMERGGAGGGGREDGGGGVFLGCGTARVQRQPTRSLAIRRSLTIC